MSLALALDQIQRPSFWSDFKACAPIRDIVAIRRSQTKQENCAEALRILRHHGKPYLFADLREDLEGSKSRISNVIETLVEQGAVKKIYDGKKLYVAATEHADNWKPEPPKPKAISKNDQAAAASREKVLAAVKAGCDRLEDLPKATGLCLATCKKHEIRLRGEGLIKAVRIPGTNCHLRILPCP